MKRVNLRYILRKIRRREHASSEDLLSFLRKKGAEIGEDVFVYDVSNTMLDKSAPFLLKIGNHVRIAGGTKILTHDYAWSVLKHYAPEGIQAGAVLGAQSPVEIGDCVFIGMNSIITRGVKIGSNVIIGAGSVVTRDCPSNGVYAGNPAKQIMTIEEYYNKRKSLQFTEAKEIVRCYRRRFHKDPPKEVFAEYFMLFSTRKEAEENETFRTKLKLMDNWEDSLNYMDENPPMFRDYETFLSVCYGGENVQGNQG